MRGLIIGLVGVAIGWQLHVYWTDELAKPAMRNTPLAAPVDLSRYSTAPTVTSSAVEPDREDELLRLLQEQNDNRAVAFYSQQLGVVSQQQSEQERALIFQTMQKRMHEKAYDSALALLDIFLTEQFRDVDALRLKADVLALQGKYDLQLDALYQARAHAYEPADLATIEAAIRAGVQTHAQNLTSEQQYAALLGFYQKLIYLEPDHSPYFIELAKAQRLNKLDQDARQSLELVLFDPLVGTQARQLLREFDTAQPGKNVAQIDEARSLPLARHGNSFIVEATLNNRTPVKLILDTGASLTVIKPERLIEATGKTFDEYTVHVFNTANGAVQGPVLKVASLAVGEFEVVNLDVGGLSLDNMSEVDGLLGMNFLKHFRFFIDQKNNVLRLALNNE